ncbi:hypothetical protein T439DRAFT_326991 [Meredithblackwellia eburnea MCA 4105]
MGLDSNLYTLEISPRGGTPGAVDFIDKSNQEHVYSAYKEDDQIHLCGSLCGWLDPSTEAHHATLTSLPADDKGKFNLKAIELISPPGTMELKNTGGAHWEWSWIMEESQYYWRRESSSLIGPEKNYTLLVKPADKQYKKDSGIPVALFQHNKKGPHSVQVLHYNLDRVDPPLQDKKGQEIIAMLTLLSFIDFVFQVDPAASGAAAPLDPRTQAYMEKKSSLDTGKGKQPAPGPSGGGQYQAQGPNGYQQQHQQQHAPRPVPQRPVDQNEIEVLDESKEPEYAQRALRLLEDKSLVFITLISRQPKLAGATIKLAEEIKRKRYKASGEELKTFVQQDKPPLPPPLPANSKKGYVPPPAPSSLKVFISRMDLGLNPEPKKPEWKPDLRPAINFDEPPPSSGSSKYSTPQPRPNAGYFPPGQGPQQQQQPQPVYGSKPSVPPSVSMQMPTPFGGPGGGGGGGGVYGQNQPPYNPYQGNPYQGNPYQGNPYQRPGPPPVLTEKEKQKLKKQQKK